MIEGGKPQSVKGGKEVSETQRERERGKRLAFLGPPVMAVSFYEATQYSIPEDGHQYASMCSRCMLQHRCILVANIFMLFREETSLTRRLRAQSPDLVLICHLYEILATLHYALLSDNEVDQSQCHKT